MKILKRFLIGLLSLTGIAIVGIFIIYQLTPKPMSYIVRNQFDTSKKKQVYTRPEKYDKIIQNINVNEDKPYKSEYQNNKMDVYSPKNINTNMPVLFWMHGGAYVGGDKRDTKDYLEMLSERTGIVIVNINYALAPENEHPTPVRQLNEAINMIKRDSTVHINWNKVYLGGDSAGAQISSEYLISLVNSDLAKDDHISPVIKKSQVKKFISLSGVLNPDGLTDISDKTSSIMFKSCGWSYFGIKGFEKSLNVTKLSLYEYSNKFSQEFFLTDGNTGSFSSQMNHLAQELDKDKVDVQRVFYDKNKAILGHEYQFDFSNKYAQETFDQLVKFIKS